MTAVVPSRGELEATRPYPARTGPKGNLIYKVITTTDHKLIGVMYMIACFAFFALAGLMALFMRAELTVPGLQFLSNEQYNQLFTMHGTAMLLFYATPIVFGFANLVLPLQIGAPDVAFPRLNALSFWLFVSGALIALGGFITPGGAADFGWTAYVPLSDAVHSPGAGADLWILGLAVGGLGTILGAVNMITTVVCMRCPGMTMFRMPIFTWNIFITSILVLLVFPLLTAALFALAADRRLGAHVYDPANGGVTLFQPGNEKMFIYDAAMKYIAQGTPTVVFGGEEYGTGSSRDWAAKGTQLLGIKAVVARSFERIHRANLVGMGVLPLQFRGADSWQTLGLTGDEQIDVVIGGELKPQMDVKLVVHRPDGTHQEVTVRLRIDTPIEVDYYKHGGILPFVLRQLLAA